MYTIYNNIEYFYDEDAENEELDEDMDIDLEEVEEEEEIEIYDIKNTLWEFIKRYENKAVKEGEFFRCFIYQIGKYTMANIFKFWISKLRGYPIVKIINEDYNIKKNKLSIQLKQLPSIYSKEWGIQFLWILKYIL